MSKYEKLLAKILRGTSDANIPFDDLCGMLRQMNFAERVRGSHQIFSREGAKEILNLQPKVPHAKPYQVKQVRGVILKYKLGGESGE